LLKKNHVELDKFFTRKRLIALFATPDVNTLNNKTRVSVLPLESSTEDAQQHGFLIQLRARANLVVCLVVLASVPSDKPFFGPQCGFPSLPGPSLLRNAPWKLPGMRQRMLGIVLLLEW
jgi:hypothetical protein